MGKHLKIFNAVAATGILAILLYTASYWVIFRLNAGSIGMPSWDDPFADSLLERGVRKAFAPASEVDDWFRIHRPAQKYLRGYWVGEGDGKGHDFIEISPDGSCRFRLDELQHAGQVTYDREYIGYVMAFHRDGGKFYLVISDDGGPSGFDLRRGYSRVSVLGSEGGFKTREKRFVKK